MLFMLKSKKLKEMLHYSETVENVAVSDGVAKWL